MNYKWMSFLCDELLWQKALKVFVSLWIKAKISSFFFLSMRSLRMRRETPLGEDPVPSILIHSLFARHPHVLCMSRLHRWITQWAPLSNLERHRITIKSICLYFLKSEQKISTPPPLFWWIFVSISCNHTKALFDAFEPIRRSESQKAKTFRIARFLSQKLSG